MSDPNGLCEFCNADRELTPEEQIEHLAQLFEDTAMLQALQMIHHAGPGTRLYIARGGRVHMTLEELGAKGMLGLWEWSP